MALVLALVLAMCALAVSWCAGCSHVEHGAQQLKTIASGGREVGPDRFRAVFVTRFDYRDELDVRRIMRQCAEAGFTDVIWQARIYADALYESSIEPWNEDLAGPDRGSVGPGFDPLGVAVREAHAYGLRLHAWVNVLTLWRGETPPQDLSHAWHRHPEWRVVDQTGRDARAEGDVWYVNPARGDVHDHIVRVCSDIASRYAIDGLHLGEVRFPWGEGEDTRVVPGDPDTQRAYAQDTGRTGISTSTQRTAYHDWLRDRITALVRRVRDESLRGQRRIVLSAAVLEEPRRANAQLQDAARWMREGTLDAVVPAIYVNRVIDLYGPLDAWIEATRGRDVYTGLGAFRHDKAEETLAEIAVARRGAGYALFGYSTFFDSADPTQPRDGAAQQDRAARRAALQRSFADYDARQPRR
ncbi:MAG: family 10 glycosylhydrolase [Phycisphaerales bacterium]|nr:family 10 glycosylhydrolase [Phycisphaerales bacterium]